MITIAAEAQGFGVTDLPAALEALEAYERSTLDATLTDSAAYVQHLLLLDAHSCLASNKAAMALVLSGSLGVRAHAKGNDAAYRARVEQKSARLAAKLGVAAGEQWEESSAEYLAGLAELRRSMAATHEQHIEELVFKRKLILHLKMQESGKNANRMAKALARNRAEVDDLLEVRASFLVLGTQDVPAPVDLDKVCGGEFPWVSDALGAAPGPSPAPPSDAAKRHFGRRYRTFKAQLDRTEEEEAFLCMEKTRTLNWLEERLAAATAAGAAAEAEGRAAAQRNDALAERSSGGKAAMALRSAKRLELTLAFARRHLA